MTTSDRAFSATAVPPDHVQYRAVEAGKKSVPTCGACGGHLPHIGQYRCPYVRCRQWLKTASEIDVEHERRRKKPSLDHA